MNPKKNHSISTFPKDDKKRVIWWYGGVETNTAGSNTPIVNVSTKILEEDTISEEVEIYRVPLPELDIVRLGKIFKGQKETKEIFTAYDKRYKTSIVFNFDFTISEPQSIHFDGQKPGTNFYNIAPYEYRLGNFENSTYKYKYQFFHSTLTKLIANDNTIVLIPSLEFLTSAIAPIHKQIRAGLIQYNLDNLLLKYVNNAEQIQDKIYQVKLTENKENMNAVLLAYLSLNPISRQRISKLWASCQKEKINPQTNQIYPEKYPHVLPFHPDNLSFKCDGIHLNENTFLVLRIYQITLPQDYEVIKVLDEDETPANIPLGGQDILKNYSSKKTLINGQDITSNIPPHRKAGTAYIESEVTLLGSSPKITEKRIPRTKSTSNHITTGFEIEPKHFSSGEECNKNVSRDTGSLRQSGNHAPKISIPHDLRDIEKALNELCDDPHCNLSNFVYIDRGANELSEATYCIIKQEELASECSGFWHKIYRFNDVFLPKSIDRNFLIIKLILNDGRYAYLLEIQKNNTKRYSGLIFNISTKLTTTCLLELLKTIVTYQAQYQTRQERGSKLKSLPLPVDIFMTFKHYDEIKAATYLNRAISRAVNENIFL